MVSLGRSWTAVAALAAALLAASAPARAAATTDAQAELKRLADRTGGVLGACIAAGGPMACVNGERPMPMQSVMKLLVAIAVLDAVDRGAWTLDEKVTLHRDDITPFASPLGRSIGDDGLSISVGDLVARAVIDSDSTAADVLIRKLGGPAAVQQVSRRSV